MKTICRTEIAMRKCENGMRIRISFVRATQENEQIAKRALMQRRVNRQIIKKRR